MKRNIDQLFSKNNINEGSFEFNFAVANVFDDMISRSVPFFQEIQSLIVNLCDEFAQPNSTIYDFGCSTGLTLFEIVQALSRKHCSFIGVDNSQDMLDLASQRFVSLEDDISVSFECLDLALPTVFQPSSVGVFNLVLQFLPIECRQSLLTAFYECLLPSGIVILVEKIGIPDDRINACFISQFKAYKRRNGYSDQEIEGKQTALKHVLMQTSKDQNIEFLKKAGFKTVETFFQWNNFIGIMGVK